MKTPVDQYGINEFKANKEKHRMKKVNKRHQLNKLKKK